MKAKKGYSGEALSRFLTESPESVPSAAQYLIDVQQGFTLAPLDVSKHHASNFSGSRVSDDTQSARRRVNVEQRRERRDANIHECAGATARLAATVA